MRYVRHLEDPDGSLVAVFFYCCRLCYTEEPQANIARLDGGWWPCLDTELEVTEPCRVCGELIGPEPEHAGPALGALPCRDGWHLSRGV